ncbi:hypothetical protein I316_06503 [Kwoniella heveanensis BCC8398]|uniref:Uncharacterized protein n=1 Tax=Kwoniella heveanensis BCC8398 TaxID=1296120 RepID=A0A1B9GLG7_9TREE|nr:hypothetical protein I316_06503 [Kwoniella heveanensis BCC8398]
MAPELRSREGRARGDEAQGGRAQGGARTSSLSNATAGRAVPPQSIVIPQSLMEDPPFTNISVIRPYLESATIPALHAEAAASAIIRFIDYRRDVEPPPEEGVMTDANTLRDDLLAARSRSYTSIMDAIQRMSDRIDQGFDEVNAAIAESKAHTTREVERLRLEVRNQRREDLARKHNRASTQMKLLWQPVPSHLNGNPTPDGINQHISRVFEINKMEPDDVNKWLAHYGLVEVDDADENKEVLSDFLGGASI